MRLRITHLLFVVGGLMLSAPTRLDAITLVDNFSIAHDYTTGNVAGTIWDGIHQAANLEPGSDTTGGVLHWRNRGEGYEGSPTFDSAPILYKNVAGDFDMSVFLPAVPTVDYSDGGLMVRAPSLDDAGAGEDWITLMRFNSVCCGDINRVRAKDGGPAWTETTLSNGQRYLRMTRTGDVFDFFLKANVADPWTAFPAAAMNRPDLHNVSLQVGLQHGNFNPNALAEMQFDDFQLTFTPVPEPGTLVLAALGLMGLFMVRRRAVARA